MQCIQIEIKGFEPLVVGIKSQCLKPLGDISMIRAEMGFEPILKAYETFWLTITEFCDSYS
jgi:hypothetical protein